MAFHSRIFLGWLGWPGWPAWLVGASLFLFPFFPQSAHADAHGGGPSGGPPPHGDTPPPGTKDSGVKGQGSDDSNYSDNPFTTYGEFNESDEEETDAKFFQNGRFFGVSLGMGFEAVDGYRGALWQGGFPTVDFRVHYWFDFNFALNLGVMTSQHFYDTTAAGLGHVDVNVVRVGLDAKYYFPVKDLSSVISFANPYILLGFGAYTLSQVSNLLGSTVTDTNIGGDAGVGLEFPIYPKKTYFELEGKINVVTFKDTYSTQFQSVGYPNLRGNLWTVTGSVLFTW